eukprot:2959550-Prymnesium_polylepis.1
MLTVNEDSGVKSCAFSPDKRRVACGNSAGGVTFRGRVRSCGADASTLALVAEPQQLRALRGLLARRHEDRVGL